MGLVMAAVGTVLIVLGTVDALGTTLRVSRRGGVMVRWLGQAVWRLLIAVDRRLPGPPRLRYLGGSIVTLVVVFTWIALTVAGWFLIFSSSRQAVVASPEQFPANGWSRLAYAMYTVFTLGGGGLQAPTTLWQLLSGVAAGTGLFLITLAITYLMPLTSAASERRRVARVLTALGRSPAAIVTDAWDGTGFSVLGQQLLLLTSELTQLAEHHLTYPLLHYFQTADLEAAIGPAVARLDEAMLLLRGVVEPSVQPPVSAVEPPRVAVTSFLATIPEVFLDPAEDVPPSPGFDELKSAGVPCRAPEEVDEVLEQQVERRRLLRGLVRSSGWSWEGSVR
ncbi:MAG: hypothetical protein M3N32_09100 [Actinomycetota bacterium]|nr:hypothetical protein [Actinomycetota bacterium]